MIPSLPMKNSWRWVLTTLLLNPMEENDSRSLNEPSHRRRSGLSMMIRHEDPIDVAGPLTCYFWCVSKTQSNKSCFHGWSLGIKSRTRSLTNKALLCISWSRIPRLPYVVGRTIVSQETLALVSTKLSPLLHRKFLSKHVTCLILSMWKHQQEATYHVVSNNTWFMLASFECFLTLVQNTALPTWKPKYLVKVPLATQTNHMSTPQIGMSSARVQI